jgi:hypothetical protein
MKKSSGTRNVIFLACAGLVLLSKGADRVMATAKTALGALWGALDGIQGAMC